MSKNIKRLFPVDNSFGNVSSSFEVTDTPVLVQMIGTQDCDYVQVEFWYGDDCGGEWAPYSTCDTPCCGCPGLYEVMHPITHFVLHIPNLYRLILRSTDPDRDGLPASFEDVRIGYKYLNTNVDISSFV